MALACLLLLAGNIAQDGGAQGTQHSRHKAAPAKPAPEVLAATPFHAGEGLAYRAVWSKYAVSAGNLKLSVMERRDFFGHAAWHFQAVAHSMDTMRLLYALDDQFDSYTDAVRLTSLQYEMYLSEQGKQQKGAWRMSSGGEPVGSPNVSTATVPLGTRDPIGLLYALRAADWKGTPMFRAPVFDGHNLYDVTAQVDQPSGQVTVPAGQFLATSIRVRVFEHGEELTSTQFTVWLAQDAARTPVLIEAEIPFGTARIELTQM
jgi:hypothetical protein